MDKISIIVPVYNVETYIRKSIKSILRQTHTNLEIILVDDGSPDNSGRICDAFAREDDRIKVIHQENAGVCAARNTALRAVTGDYIGFVDPDDYAEPDMFEYLLTNLKEHDADISCCGFSRIFRDHTSSFTVDDGPKVTDGKGAVEELITSFHVKAVFWNKLFKRELFDGVWFPEGVIYEGTLMVHKLLMAADKVVFLPEAKYNYVDNIASYVNDKSIKNQLDYVNALIARYQDLEDDFPHLKVKLMTRLIREVSKLTKLCYLYKDSYTDFVSGIETAGAFLAEKRDFLNTIKWRSKATPDNIAFVIEPTVANLEKAHSMQVKYDGPKDRKVTEDLEAASKRKLPKKKKITTNIDDLTIEDKEIFRRLHDVELEIMDEFARICDKYGLRYYLYGGTLLGAVRHKGFIPWDDDIDIVMPRADYDRFAEVCKDELRDDMFYQTINTDPNSPYLYAKLRKNNTHVTEEWLRNVDMHQGIFIDILPLDYFPVVSEKKRASILGNFNVLHCASQQKTIQTRRRLYRLKFRYYSRKPKNQVRALRDRYIRNVAGGRETELVCSFGSHYKPLSKRIFPAEWFTGRELTMEFEGRQFKVPAGWKEYLEHLFGERYMEWPPIEKRVNHFNYYDICFDTTKENANG